VIFEQAEYPILTEYGAFEQVLSMKRELYKFGIIIIIIIILLVDYCTIHETIKQRNQILSN